MAGEYIDDMIGGISSIINGIKMLVIIIVLLISVLIVVLMERSFISKEKSEIALLKAIGFKNNTVICWHVLRIFIVIFDFYGYKCSIIHTVYQSFE